MRALLSRRLVGGRAEVREETLPSDDNLYCRDKSCSAVLNPMANGEFLPFSTQQHERTIVLIARDKDLGEFSFIFQRQ